ncbi:sushi domain-containing protein 6-like isoform X1 [Acipenser oxyrinchus oxyrinchus]|uniref:Sushi domain-containing protein 6-like isoform X1 n=1 Tax=Acipenser oxyrinchus oxyrinchus TaxID=40147 RepID=A0AAD8CP53_ACIOX|nr:sushi domain-containing protein 6-like isoform X1 [Acipenser oxyrinchus oxyrinchus]
MPAHPMTSVTGCLGSLLCCGTIVLLLLCDDAMGAEANSTAGQPCSHPLVPSTVVSAAPSPCRGFAPKRVIEYFCEPGYSLHGAARTAHCRHGKWSPTGPPYCTPDLKSNPGSGDSDTTDQESSPLPPSPDAAVAVSVFLLTTTACILVKPRVRVCQCDSRRLSDQLGLMIDSPPVLLPSYEEAVYGNQGNLAPPTRGPTQLLCVERQLDPAHRPPGSQSDSSLGGLANCCAETLPLLTAVQSHSGGMSRGGRNSPETFRVSMAIGKDV